MAYIVTARKWRPNRFDEVVGQEHITTTLKNAIRNNRIAHAYIFAGPRGVGKTTTARILAKTLNCLNPVDFDPCNECEMCRSFNTSQSLDIIEIDGASNRRIEEIRTLRDSVKYAPTKGTYKVYIIDEVHMLTNESFNALLKTLEEPPEHTIFIFATTDVHKVPLTIISRCQRFDFRRIELATIKSTLRNIADTEKIDIDDQTLTIIAKKADGALRDAESLFDQIVSFSEGKIAADVISRMLNLIGEEVYFQISDAVLEKEYVKAFEITQLIYENGWNFIDFMNGLTEHFRNIMTVAVTGSSRLIEASEAAKARYLKYKGIYKENDVLRILGYLNKTYQELKQIQNQRLKTEVALCHLIGIESTSSIKEVLNNLEELKKKASSGNLTYTSSSVTSDSRSAQAAPKAAQLNVASESSSTSGTKILAEGDDFTIVTSKWSTFTEEIMGEKFIVGSAINVTRPIGTDGNRLYVNIEDPYLKNTMMQAKEYLFDKSKEIFGKGFFFEFDTMQKSAGKSAAEFNDDFNPAPIEVIEVPTKEDNPMVRSIKEELGGEEIS
ncbi:MAG: DNA polymerase III subunit gamma/tau [Syntrophothermus sp.]